MSRSLERLQKQLSYHFCDVTLLNNALTHRSVGSKNNERLEYLGDAILGFIVASELYQRFPKAKEGDLSRLRANLVRGQTLAEVARELDLGEWLNLGPGEMKSGGERRDSILAGAMEAVIGAVYIDRGIAAATALVKHLLDARIDALSALDVDKDPKTRLQEYLQGRKRELPTYVTLSITGVEHAQEFQVSCVVEGMAAPAVGSGQSRRVAEQQAADMALQILTTRDR